MTLGDDGLRDAISGRRSPPMWERTIRHDEVLRRGMPAPAVALRYSRCGWPFPPAGSTASDRTGRSLLRSATRQEPVSAG